jgi:hypothetical protein
MSTRHSLQGGRAEIGGITEFASLRTFRAVGGIGGSAYHIAFRAADDEAEFAMMKRLAENHGIRTTDQRTATTSDRSISAASCSTSGRTLPASP